MAHLVVVDVFVFPGKDVCLVTRVLECKGRALTTQLGPVLIVNCPQTNKYESGAFPPSFIIIFLLCSAQ